MITDKLLENPKSLFLQEKKTKKQQDIFLNQNTWQCGETLNSI